MPKLEVVLRHYDYQLPKELIAQAPLKPRDRARLLIYRPTNSKTRASGAIKFDRFYNIGKYLPKNSVLVFNQTKVVPARLWMKKPSGGKVQILYIGQEDGLIKVIADRKLSIGSILQLNQHKFIVKNQKENFYFLKLQSKISIEKLMQKFGQTPLPPYIKNSPLTESQRRKEYQSIFAKAGLSVAAPTASLHFTKKLISKLKKQGIEVKFVTLNVNLGTFAPLKEENLKTGTLHSETYEIDKKTAYDLNRLKKESKTIIAVGTTVVRTLESAARPFHSRESGNPEFEISKLSGDTKLFIRPGYKFKFVDGLITNFHVPNSSLMMLVGTLIGRKKLLELYQKAIKNKFRFFSFGDGMLILK